MVLRDDALWSFTTPVLLTVVGLVGWSVGLARTQRGRVCTVLPAVLCNRRAQVSGDKRAPATCGQPTLHPAIMFEPSLLLHVLTCPDCDACFLICAFRLFYESFPMLKEPLRRARERRKDAGLRASATRNALHLNSNSREPSWAVQPSILMRFCADTLVNW